MPPIEADFRILAITLAVGAALGVAYDCYQVVFAGVGTRVSAGRRRRGPFPIGYWLFAAAFAWFVIALAFAGQVRGYMFLGIGMGAVLYALTVSGPIRRALAAIRLAVARLLSGMVDVVTAVVLFPVHLAARVIGGVASLLAVVLSTPGRLVLAAADYVGGLGGRAIQALVPRIRRPTGRE